MSAPLEERLDIRDARDDGEPGQPEPADFSPRGLYRNPHFQSVLASAPLRRPLVLRRARSLLAGSREELLDAGDGIRLHAWFAGPPPGVAVRGLAVLIHGWEGSGASLYLLSAASRLHQEGWQVLRLNLRDHGPSHHLNKDLFHSNRLPEVVAAIATASRSFGARPMVLGGFSLGGNFALRVAARAGEAGIPLARVMAICPVLDPASTLWAMENAPRIYERYFMLKWRRSLARKAECFPDYDFGDLRRFRGLRDMTDYFVHAYSEYPDLDSYLAGYAIVGDVLTTLQVPTRLIASQDDPVIPVTDLERLARPRSLTVQRVSCGGHCGFLTGYFDDRWINDQLAAWFAGAAAE